MARRDLSRGVRPTDRYRPRHKVAARAGWHPKTRGHDDEDGYELVVFTDDGLVGASPTAVLVERHDLGSLESRVLPRSSIRRVLSRHPRRFRRGLVLFALSGGAQRESQVVVTFAWKNRTEYQSLVTYLDDVDNGASDYPANDPV